MLVFWLRARCLVRWLTRLRRTRRIPLRLFATATRKATAMNAAGFLFLGAAVRGEADPVFFPLGLVLQAFFTSLTNVLTFLAALEPNRRRRTRFLLLLMLSGLHGAWVVRQSTVEQLGPDAEERVAERCAAAGRRRRPFEGDYTLPFGKVASRST